jgi:hypothetical protein
LDSEPVTREAIINGLWAIGVVVVFVAVFVLIMVRSLKKRSKNTFKVKKEGTTPSVRERNYREWKVAGLKSRKGLYIKDKNLCPCGSGLQYKDCCGN